MPEREIKNGEVEIETYYKAFKILIRLPYENGAAIQGFVKKLSENCFTPERNSVEVKPPTPEKTPYKESESHLCPIHQVPMEQFHKNGKSWYSHRVDGGWCSGKQRGL